LGRSATGKKTVRFMELKILAPQKSLY